MARFCAAIRTPIAFKRSIGPLAVEVLTAPPETVGIEFERRLLVWHAFEPREDPDSGRTEEFGPTVSVVVKGDTDSHGAADSLQRFLSALAYLYDQPAEVVHYGGDGEIDPYHPPPLRMPRAHAGWMLAEPFTRMDLRPEPALRLCMAYYREGLNAGSPFFRFLSFWNCLDAVFEIEDDSTLRDAFLDQATPQFRQWWDERYPFPPNSAEAFRDDSRNAIAHVLRRPGKTMIDPDESEDRARLDRESQLLHRLARAAIERLYPHPVSGG